MVLGRSEIANWKARHFSLRFQRLCRFAETKGKLGRRIGRFGALFSSHSVELKFPTLPLAPDNMDTSEIVVNCGLKARFVHWSLF